MRRSSVRHGRSPDASRLTPHVCSVFNTPWGWMGTAVSATGARAGVCRIVLPRVSRRTVEATLYRESLGEGRKGTPSRLTPGTHCSGECNGSPSRLTILVEEARAQLIAFLEGKRRELDFPIDLSGGSAFQRRVWRAILRIPYGRVRSYKWVALRVGGAGYARAVGHALGANPVPIVIPCHRVVAQDASLGGFTGGLKTKRRLLQLEGTLPQLHPRKRNG